MSEGQDAAHPLPPVLGAWIPRQRWFAGKAGTPVLDVVSHGSTRLSDAVVLEEWLVKDSSDPAHPVYYVPVTVRSDDPKGLGHARIDAGDGVASYDAPHDPLYAAGLLAAATGQDGRAPVRAGASTVLTGEQSNTSILYWVDAEPSAAPPAIILKVFRRMNEGDNPDVVLQSALSAAGVLRVPYSVGHLSRTWADEEGVERTGHVAFAQEFVPGVEDAWRVMLRASGEGKDTTAALRDLGTATAEVHAALRRLFPAETPTAERIAAIVASMRERADAAIAAVPALEPESSRIRSVHDRIRDVPWPDLQRVHGDLHLGQVLLAPERGWLIVDFEGEPLRPLTERAGNDVPLRDVAGMLRSLDYAAAVSARAGHPLDPGWTEGARAAFLEGYDERAEPGASDFPAALTALELDKALYEALYEAGNRPDWLAIPLGAIDGLLARLEGLTEQDRDYS